LATTPSSTSTESSNAAESNSHTTVIAVAVSVPVVVIALIIGGIIFYRIKKSKARATTTMEAVEAFHSLGTDIKIACDNPQVVEVGTFPATAELSDSHNVSELPGDHKHGPQ
jgi:uncharacterized protein HemX